MLAWHALIEKYTYFPLEIDAFFFRNISVTRNPCKYRPLKAHLLTLHPAWQVAGGNWLLHCIAIAKAQPSKGNKALATIANASPWALDPIIGGIISIRHTTEIVDKTKISNTEVTDKSPRKFVPLKGSLWTSTTFTWTCQIGSRFHFFWKYNMFFGTHVTRHL